VWGKLFELEQDPKFGEGRNALTEFAQRASFIASETGTRAACVPGYSGPHDADGPSRMYWKREDTVRERLSDGTGVSR